MPLDLYLKETANLARKQSALLDDVYSMLHKGEKLTPLQESGVLHTLQILIKNAIGKTKQLLKFAGEPVPTSAYDAMEALVRTGQLPAENLPQWISIIGLRNRIVHDYMNMDISRVIELVEQQKYQFIVDFLLTPIHAKG
jgi:uncharacterized protein YutE (UPF0331/DUF86 family)